MGAGAPGEDSTAGVTAGRSRAVVIDGERGRLICGEAGGHGPQGQVGDIVVVEVNLGRHRYVALQEPSVISDGHVGDDVDHQPRRGSRGDVGSGPDDLGVEAPSGIEIVVVVAAGDGFDRGRLCAGRGDLKRRLRVLDRVFSELDKAIGLGPGHARISLQARSNLLGRLLADGLTQLHGAHTRAKWVPRRQVDARDRAAAGRRTSGRDRGDTLLVRHDEARDLLGRVVCRVDGRDDRRYNR